MENRKIVLPENVKKIIETLQTHGYEAYAVGGCVRDSVLGRIPQDWDITTSAMPQETKHYLIRHLIRGLNMERLPCCLEETVMKLRHTE